MYGLIASSILQERVSPASVPDYCVHVAATDEVWLSLIRKRAKNGTHYSLESLVRDFEQMAANARAYNTPGKGRWGDTGKPFIPKYCCLFVL